MLRYFSFIFFILSLIACHTSKIGNLIKKENIFDESNNYFDCNYYHYFSDTTKPYISKEDSMLLIDYGLKNNQKFRDIREMVYFLPDLKLTYNKKWQTILFNDSERKTTYCDLDWYKLRQLINSDAVILGQVIDKQNTSLIDTNKCLNYKSTIIVKVSEVLNSYFKITPGNLVMIKSMIGYNGCGTSNKYSLISHIKDYEIGDKDLFLISNQNLRMNFLQMQPPSRYYEESDDLYCSQAFILDISNSTYDYTDEVLLKNIRQLFKNINSN